MSPHGFPAPDRVRIVATPRDTEADEMRAAAEREGMSLSAWLVAVGLERARATADPALLGPIRDLRAKIMELDDMVLDAAEALSEALDRVSSVAGRATLPLPPGRTPPPVATVRPCTPTPRVPRP